MSFNELPDEARPDLGPAAQPASPSALGEAYQHGYADGHRAGWDVGLQAGLSQLQQRPTNVKQAAPKAAQAAATVSNETSTPGTSPRVAVPPIAVPPVLTPWVAATPAHTPLGSAPLGSAPPLSILPNPARFSSEPARVIPEKVQNRLASLKKHRRDQANINIALYTASMLLIAAAWLFAGFNISGAARFGSLCILTGLFYAAGLVLHAKVKRLRPAGLAFTGTGLALVPIAGFALNAFVLQAPALSWLITSAIGTIAYLFAALRLRSVVLVWLTLTFVVSSQFAGLNVLGSAIIWYLVAMIAFAAVLNAVNSVVPRRVRESRLLLPLRQLSPFLVPAVVISAFILSSALLVSGQALVLGVSAGYYLVLLLAAPQRERWTNFLGFRLTLTFAVGLAAAWLSPSPAAFITAVAVMGTLQLLMEVFARDALGAWLGPLRAYRSEPTTNPMDITFFTTFVLSQLLNALWFIAYLVAGPAPLTDVLLPVLLALVPTMIATAVFGHKYASLPAIPVGLYLLFASVLGVWRVEIILAVALAYAGYQWWRSAGVWRAGYLLAARIVASSALALVITAFPSFPNQYYLTFGIIVVLCCAQLVFEAWSIGTNKPGLFAEAVAWFWMGSALMAGCAIVLRMISFDQLLAPEPSQLLWARIAAGVLTLSILAAAFWLRRQWLTRKYRSLEALVPVAFAVLFMLQARDAVSLALLSIVFLGYTVLMLQTEPRRLHRGLYVLMARLSAVILVFALADYFTWDVHARWIALGTMLLLQQGAAMLLKPERFPAQRITIWVLLGLQVVSVPSYWFMSSTDSHRWLVFGLLSAVTGSAALAQWVKKIDGAVYLGIGGLLSMVLTITEIRSLWFDIATGSVFSGGAASLILAGFALACMGLRLRYGRAQGTLRWAWVWASSWYLLVAAVLLSSVRGWFWLIGMIVALLALVLLSASWLERVRFLVLPGTLAAIYALGGVSTNLLDQVFLGLGPAALAWRGLVLLLASIVLLYGLRWVLAALGLLDNIRRWYLLAPLAGLAGIVLGLAITQADTALAAALIVLGIGVIAWFETSARYRKTTVEVGVVVASAVLQRGIYAAHEMPRPFWFITWYLATALLLVLFRLLRKEEVAARIRMMVVAGLLSIAALSTIFSGTGLEQIASLVGFGLLLGYGLVRGDRLFVVWAAAGIFTSVLWWLRDYTFIMLTLVALMLIGIAVWQLVRKKPKTET